jgi:precorrin-2 dehydrogenase/sirohydrochlorin ferrochelatase
MDSFPAFFPLAGRTVVIAGAGEAAEAKARLFEGSPASVIRLDDAAHAARPEAYAGAALAFIAGWDEPVLARAAAAARAAGVPVNVTDHPALCDFITPAVIDRGEVVAAVATSGAAPMLASLLRNDIEARIPEGAGRIAALLKSMNEEVRAALPDLAARRIFLAEAMRGPAAEAAIAGDIDGARQRLRAALGAAEPATNGRLIVIVVDGPADLISLRAARALAEADALVIGEGCPTAIEAMARRDAPRLFGPALEPAALAARAATGARIVWAGGRNLDAAIPAAFDQAGLPIERLYSAPA